MHFREGNRIDESVPPIAIKSRLLRIDAHKPKLFGLNSKKVKYMKWLNRKNTVEKVVEENEQRFVIEVGHNRNNELIIKKMRVSGDDLDKCIAELQIALQNFKILRAEQ
tara:strand:+ start:493 stop:819 length:327 start_codon:yes stop_codon:yes gene_type:complete